MTDDIDSEILASKSAIQQFRDNHPNGRATQLEVSDLQSHWIEYLQLRIERLEQLCPDLEGVPATPSLRIVPKK